MRLYIAGPISNMPRLNKPAFVDAAAKLVGAGYEVRDPFLNGLDLDADWRDHMRADIAMLLQCDGVALLDGWEDSRGAWLEETIAHALGMPRKPVGVWTQEAT